MNIQAPIQQSCHWLVYLPYLFISQGVQELMIRAEEEISQDGVPVAHHHILIQQSRLGN